jgi:hypothetical protein
MELRVRQCDAGGPDLQTRRGFDMTRQDDDRQDDNGVYRSEPNRPPATRRMQIAAGVTGLAALLGGGAYVITNRIVNHDGSGVTQDVGALAPVAPGAASPSSAAPSESAATPSASPTSATPSATPTTSPTRSPDPAEVRKQIQAARDKAAKDGIPLQRPLKPKGKMVAEGQISSRTEQTSEGSIRISSARADLSGQGDRLLAADDGTPVGHARCAHKVHFSADAPAREIPTLLLCWRTSSERSVVTLAVSKQGRPSAAASAATIDREWAKLG